MKNVGFARWMSKFPLQRQQIKAFEHCRELFSNDTTQATVLFFLFISPGSPLLSLLHNLATYAASWTDVVDDNDNDRQVFGTFSSRSRVRPSNS